MDVDQPKPLWSHEIALRSKEQVILEDWKAPDQHAAWLIRQKRDESPAPADLKTWTTLRTNTVTLFYQAHSSPPIPSMEEINDATARNPLHGKLNLHNVCKIGDTVVKWCASPGVIEVSQPYVQ
jgi:hypothetical protein